MDDKTNSTEDGAAIEPERLLGLGVQPLEAIHLNDGAIDKLADLGAEASSLTVTRLPRLNVLGPGLPEDIPIGLRKGDNPGVFSLKDEIERYRLFPARKTGTAKALTLDSFIGLVSRHATEDTAIFANSDWKKPGLLAVIDYHVVDSTQAANLKHRVTYEFPLSEPWKTWVGQNGEFMDQAEFAAFIEDNIADLSSPEIGEINDYESRFGTKIATPAELIQLSRGLQVFAATNVKNAVTLQSGEGSIVFEEEHRDAAGNKLIVPGLFILNVEPFFMGDRIRVPVRLRYRLSGGALKWMFQIYRPDIAVTDRVRTDLDIVRRETTLPVFEGFPESHIPG